MTYYFSVTVSCREGEVVSLAESQDLPTMKRLAELISRHALPGIAWVKIQDQDCSLYFFWQAAAQEPERLALRDAPPASKYVN